jgi:hypothetical protein
MRLFGRKGKAWEKWRAAARFIDLHETKIVVIKAKRVAEPVPDSPSIDQVLREMLNAVSDDSRAGDLSASNPIDYTAKVKYQNPNAWRN